MAGDSPIITGMGSETEIEEGEKMGRTMTIEDYDGVYALWKKIRGFGLRSIDDSRDGSGQRFLKRNPTTSVVAVSGRPDRGKYPVRARRTAGMSIPCLCGRCIPAGSGIGKAMVV